MAECECKCWPYVRMLAKGNCAGAAEMLRQEEEAERWRGLTEEERELERSGNSPFITSALREAITGKPWGG